MVSFITVAGFLNGPGFERMRDYFRRTTDEVWIIDCSPEGHQPEVSTRLFQGVQQPVCIMLASRSPRVDVTIPAKVRYAALPEGHRREKFDALSKLALDGASWQLCPSEWRAPFLPAATGAWAEYPALDDFFVYNGSGVMPGRTWVIAPDQRSLRDRWNALRAAPAEKKEALFHPHLSKDKLGDRHVNRLIPTPLTGHVHRPATVAADSGDAPLAVAYGFRSFDRQWIIADNRLINRPNPTLWDTYSASQMFLTAPKDRSPSGGPAITFSAAVADLHHYNGRGGRVYPLWSDAQATRSNVSPSVLSLLSDALKFEVSGADVFAYIAAVAANPAYTARFEKALVQPGLRIPLTSDPELFREAVELGRTIVWLHSYGERFVDASAGRPLGAPRVVGANAPVFPRAGAIPSSADAMPDTMTYDAATKKLSIGTGYIENVSPAVWDYEVSGKQILRQWFSYRKRNRERPIIGDRRPPSALGDIQPDHWLSEYTTDLINLLHVLQQLVELEPM